jgi:hypothetical protein
MQVSKTPVFDESWTDDLDAGWDDIDRVTAHRIAILQAYFTRFGLWDQQTSRAAARRVVSELLQTTVDWNDKDFDRRLVAVARKWIRDFSESCGPVPDPIVDAPVSNWLSRASMLLSKFPSTFLATPLPNLAH